MATMTYAEEGGSFIIGLPLGSSTHTTTPTCARIHLKAFSPKAKEYCSVVTYFALYARTATTTVFCPLKITF